MLTADLAQSWQRGGRTGPRYIETEDAAHLQEASDLIGLFKEHRGQRRADLDQALEEYVGTGTDYRVLRGLIKLLMDRCEFETACGADPVEIRRALFLKARQHHPVTGNETVRAEVIADAARELNCAPEVVLEGLYADLPENQKLVDFEAFGPQELLDRYNVAQAQALLYRCVEMRLMVSRSDPAGYRELFGAIKAYRLIHTIKGNAVTGYEVRLDGPVSMFHRSQKYGVQMAVFLPALLTIGGWRMRAEIVSKMKGRAFFELNSDQTQLRSHYLSVPPYENPVLERLETAWARSDTSWSLEPGSEVVDLGESAFIPDFIIRHPTGQQVYLEVLGFWTPQHLKERLKEFEHGRVRNFIIAAWEELRGSREPPAKLPDNVIVFKRSLDPAAVELVLDQLVSDA
jgi:uncharacterized protein